MYFEHDRRMKTVGIKLFLQCTERRENASKVAVRTFPPRIFYPRGTGSLPLESPVIKTIKAVSWPLKRRHKSLSVSCLFFTVNPKASPSVQRSMIHFSLYYYSVPCRKYCTEFLGRWFNFIFRNFNTLSIEIL